MDIYAKIKEIKYNPTMCNDILECFDIEATVKKTVSILIDDIKDGLIKMILFSNLSDVSINGNIYKSKAVLKLTGIDKINPILLKKIEYEAGVNNFIVDVG